MDKKHHLEEEFTEAIKNAPAMPKLIFDDWKLVKTDGWPPDAEWCMALWVASNDETDIFVGGYSEENKNFYANFGLGGAVLKQEYVFAWMPLFDYRWKMERQGGENE